MKDLFFSITLNNHTFNICTNNERTRCSYVIDDIYKTYLVFASNTFAFVEYKNACFKSAVTKQNNWYLCLDLNTIIRKRYNDFFFETRKKQQNIAIEKATDNELLEYSKNVLYFYDLLIKEFAELYSDIRNKKELKNQLCEYLEDNYNEYENPYEIIEYEIYEDDDMDAEPLIERITVLEEIINDAKELLVSFRQAEIDSECKELIFTLENVIKETHELCKVPHSFLHKEFKNYLAQYNDKLTEPNIYYNQLDKLNEIGIHLYDTYQHSVFMNTLETRIDKILFAMDNSVVNKEEISSHFKMQYDKKIVPNDKEFTKSVKDYVHNYMDFYNLYNKFVNLFDSDSIKIVWDNKTIQLFEKYDKGEIPIDSQHFAEYEVYKYIIPYYRKHFFIKNTNKYKPIIDKLPDFVSYATSVFDILFKYHILIDAEDRVVYNEDGDINSAFGEIAKISAN